MNGTCEVDFGVSSCMNLFNIVVIVVMAVWGMNIDVCLFYQIVCIHTGYMYIFYQSCNWGTAFHFWEQHWAPGGNSCPRRTDSQDGADLMGSRACIQNSAKMSLTDHGGVGSSDFGHASSVFVVHTHVSFHDRLRRSLLKGCLRSPWVFRRSWSLRLGVMASKTRLI